MKHQEIYEKLYFLQEAYNKHTNLTRINSKEDYYLKHVADSIAIIPFLNRETSIIDIGSGGGYPGFPLAIELPQTKITLNDSILKKTKYLEATAKQLELTNISVVRGRAEALGQNSEYRQRYQAAIARAVAHTAELLQIMTPLVCPGGRLYIMKSCHYEEELAKAKALQSKLRLLLEHVHKYRVGDIDRVLLIFRK